MLSRGRQFRSVWTSTHRALTFGEVSNALRPFFFAVHPDRFAAHPEIRQQNEKSLQAFNGYINDLFPISPSLRPTTVRFSIADKKANKFRDVDIKLSGTDPIRIVREALRSCEITTKHLETTIGKAASSSPVRSSPASRPFSADDANQDLLKTYLKKKKKSTANNLRESLSQFRDDAVRKSRETGQLRMSIKDEIDDLKDRTGLKDVVWQMDWAETHMRRCISNLHRFLDQATPQTRNSIIQAFYKNVLRFGRGSFTCCDGSIQLGADHVPEQWEQACFEFQVRRSQIPALRQSVEQLQATLGNAVVLTPHYKGLAQTLTQIQSLIVRIWNREALLPRLAKAGAGTMIEVVTSYDELSVGIDGRLFVPCNVDVPSLTVFLEDNAAKSQQINRDMQVVMNELEDTRQQCISDLHLEKLDWEKSLDLREVLACVHRLMLSPEEVKNMVTGLKLYISRNSAVYVHSDGTVSVPINWV